jgi:hypothetical protein
MYVRRYRFIDPTNPHAVEAVVYNRSGVIVKLPKFWVGLDVLIYFDDGNITRQMVCENTTTESFAFIAAIYTGKIVKVRLAERLSFKVDMSKQR